MKSRLFPLFFLLTLFALGLAGCASPDNSAVMAAPGPEANLGDTAVARLHVGDTVTVVFSGIPGDDMAPHEEPIKEDGTITLPDIGHVKAAGKTAGELQDAIHALYVPGFYTHLTVTVKTTGDRVYYVRGEVKGPGRQIYVGQITVSKAITSAGDFNDFANRRKVWLTRANGQRFRLNCVRILDGEDPDPPVYPGDQIEVTRRLF
jgi:polysaccharide export outer membrane protein